MLLAYYRRHSYTRPLLHYSQTILLLPTLCWPSSFLPHISGHIPKFGQVFSYMLDVLDLFTLQQKTLYWIIVSWLSYLHDLCCTVSAPDGCSLRYTERGMLIDPFTCTAMKQNCASVVSPVLGEGLLLVLHFFPKVHSGTFYAHPKADLFSCAGVSNAHE